MGVDRYLLHASLYSFQYSVLATSVLPSGASRPPSWKHLRTTLAWTNSLVLLEDNDGWAMRRGINFTTWQFLEDMAIIAHAIPLLA
jgi:hypothetical protein